MSMNYHTKRFTHHQIKLVELSKAESDKIIVNLREPVEVVYKDSIHAKICQILEKY